MIPGVPLGLDDFRKLREQGLLYVDKSYLIRDVLDRGAQSILLPRPRRFGKTLNLSMLRCFFEKRAEDFSHLFADLAIMQAGERYRAHFQRYPVIFITFKELKAKTWDEARRALHAKIRTVFDEHNYLLGSERLSDHDRADVRAILDGKATDVGYQFSLLLLSRCLARHHGQDVVMLIDEYDTPIHAGWLNGYGEDILTFFRTLLNAGLKGNPHLFKAVVTGILRVAKESIFSDLNNLAVYTVLANHFSTCFGFTEAEVGALLDRVGLNDSREAVRDWYNGYVFGGTIIYNPWSILSFVERGESRPRSYWVSTSSNDLVRDMLVRHGSVLKSEIEALLEGQKIEAELDEGVALSELSRRPDVIFSLLLFSGYLKAEQMEGPLDDAPRYLVSIPNREVRGVYTNTFLQLLQEHIGGPRDVERLTSALLAGDVEEIEAMLSRFAESVLSYHDVARRPEQVYHMFILGLLATLEPAYEVRSNRESGHGRPDLMIRPRGKPGPGVVLELKIAEKGRKTMARALAEGAEQLKAMKYRSELTAAGISPIHALVVGFDGKKVKVQPVADRAKRAAPKKKALTRRKGL